MTRRLSACACAAALIVVAVTGRPADATTAPAHLVFRIADPRIGEASGIAPGRLSPGVEYVENDSGDVNRFFALDADTGTTAATITVRGARNVDWEDIAAAPDAAGTPSVWLADIGDNDAMRSEVQVYRVDEPRVRATDRGRVITTRAADLWRLRYPHGAIDAESFAVAPDGTGYIVTKSFGTSTVYRLPDRPNAARVQLLQRVGVIAFAPTGTPNPFGIAGQVTATSAAVAPDGSALVVRTYSDAYVWALRDADVGAALARPPVRIALPEQPQGEGVGIRDHTLLIDSEGAHSAVYSMPLPRPEVGPGRAPSSAAARSGRVPVPSAPTPDAGSGASGADLEPLLLGAGAAVVLVAAGLLVLRRRRPR